jgi:hypothetical protein
MACWLAVVACALWCPATAPASVGPVVFDGGSPAEQTQVINALQASSFDWRVLPEPITVHVGSFAAGGFATPGAVFLDSGLLDSGEFSWGTVQHEFAHEVDFLLLHKEDHTELEAALHAKDWCYEVPGLSHADQGCERFASELSWAYWPSSENAMSPSDIGGGESTGMPPAAFRALLAELLDTPGVSTPVPSLTLPAPASRLPGFAHRRPTRGAWPRCP